MKNIFFGLFGFLGLLNAIAPSALACTRVTDSDFSIAGSYQSGKQTSHGRPTLFELGGCKPFSGQFLVLVGAPVYTDPTFKSLSSPEGELPDERCSIDQSPFNISKPQDIKIDDFYQLETRFLNTCLEMEVTDTRGEIDTAQQVNCDIIQVDRSKVIAKGPRCAFKIYDNSNFKVNYRLRNSCLNKKFLKEMGDLRPMDIKASLGIYKTPDLTPGNPDYEILTLSNARITLQPESGLIPVSTYSGTVGSEWPMQYGTQVEMGRLSLNKTQRLHAAPYVYLRTPFLVNNNCPEKCKDGICTSPCDFFAPVAARMILMKKGANETAFHGIDYWYQGNLVPPKFIGELSLGKAISDPNVVVGDRYLLIAEFANPALTYRTIIGEAKQLLIDLSTPKIPTRNAGRATGLEGLTGLGSNIVTEMDGLPEMGRMNEGQMDLEPMIAALNRAIGVDDSWPPYYDTIINGDQNDNANRNYMTLKVGFRVSNITPFGVIAMDHVMYAKESKIFGNYEKLVTNPPQIKCVNPQ